MLLIFAIAGCTSELYQPTPTEVYGTATFEELKQGRKLYVDKCSSCHALVLPEKLSPEQWQLQVTEMEQKVAITKSEKTLILKYLTKGKI